MTPVSLITRSRERSVPLVDILEKAGRHVLVDPLFRVEPFNVEPPPSLSGCCAVIITSLYAFEEMKTRLDVPRDTKIFCVGDKTASLIKAEGFASVTSARTVDDLMARLAGETPGTDEWMLYVRGWVVTHNLPEAMERHDIIVREWTVYDTPAALELSKETRDALKNRAVREIFLFSHQSADTFVNLCRKHDIIDDLATVRAIVISDRVAAMLPPQTFGRITVAGSPDMDGMVDAARRAIDPGQNNDRAARTAVPSGGGFAPFDFFKDIMTEHRSTGLWVGGVTLALLALSALMMGGNKAPDNTGAPREVLVQPAQPLALPKDISEKIETLTRESQQAIETMKTYKDSAEKLAGDVSGMIGELKGGEIGARLQAVEQQVGGIVDAVRTQNFAAFINNIGALQASPDGQQLLSGVIGQITQVVTRTQGQDPASIDAALIEAQASGPLAQTMQGFTPQEMKAAALLVGMAQMRSSLMRDRASFDSDLQILRSFVGENDPDLLVEIDRLSPMAQSGVLTPDGLTREFKGLAGDIVSASLKGEDVSLEDRVNARIADFVTIAKDGQPVNGTATQKAVTLAQTQLDKGDIQGAMETLQALEGPAAEAAQPWIADAQATLLAGNVQGLLTSAISRQYAGAQALPGASSPSPLAMPSITGGAGNPVADLLKAMGAAGLGNSGFNMPGAARGGPVPYTAQPSGPSMPPATP